MENKDRNTVKSPVNVPPSPHAVPNVNINSDTNTGALQEDKEFKLAPTPAQLGKAPLQRRQSMGLFCWLYGFIPPPKLALVVLTNLSILQQLSLSSTITKRKSLHSINIIII